MLVLALKLFLAHFIGDFVCQPNAWVRHKEKHKHRSKYLYWHVFVHFLVLIILLQFDFSYWIGITLITVSHFIIDLAKLHLNDRTNNRILFALDQLAHFIIIGLVLSIYYPFKVDLHFIFEAKTLLLLTSFVCLTQVTSVVMKTIISKWDLKDFDNESSLKDAGAYIGILERLFVFMFIITNHWEGVGFLIAAKSVFRFGDLSKAKDRKLTEYVLIGTLLSFGLAILIALGYNYISNLI
ncbi:DUF3307 domain-containing protein [Pseudotamlana agarivorans]|uniref:DUF3307 domain-containing protein n=1 Tax=Pseudotamlana agarivorans TaxID=481183 RepID=UPI0008329A8D|nr:DUF3307 domain-containing protein [Tamlana agarivorans]